MIRLLHLVAILGLISSAGYAYSIKYDTLYYAEEVAKLRTRLHRERDAIAVAKAEWALLTRPDRLQRMVDEHLDMQPMSVSQLGRMADLPVRPPRADAIGLKLEALVRDGGGPTATPKEKRMPKPEGIGAKLEALMRDPAATATPKDRRIGEAKTPATTGSLAKAVR